MDASHFYDEETWSFSSDVLLVGDQAMGLGVEVVPAVPAVDTDMVP